MALRMGLLRYFVPSRQPGRFEEAPSRSRSLLFREFLGFGSSSVILQVSRVVSGLVVAALLGPATWGWWYLLNLIVAYGALTQLGALNGLNREVPAALGRGQAEESVALRRVALGVVLAATGGVSVVLLAVAWWWPGIVSLTDLALVVALLITHQAFGYVSTCLKATTNFFVVARLQFVLAVGYPVFGIAGAWAYGLPGFIVGQAVAYMVATVIASRHPEVVVAPRVDVARVRSLVSIGFPIMLVGVVHTLFSTVDRWVVVAFLGAEPLGYYSLAIMALGAVGLLPQVIAQQLYPRMAHAWAARSDTAELRSLAGRVRRMSFVVVVPVALVGLLVAPPAVRALLPAFAAGIPALMVTLFVPVVGAVGQGYGSVLHMLDRQSWLLAAIIVSALVNVGLSLLLVGPFGLVGVAYGTLGAFACFSALRVALGAKALEIEERGLAQRVE